jgi:hypothetical protein
MRFPFGFGKKPSGPPPQLPEFYLQVRDYVLAILEEMPPNETFEATILSENGFNSLGSVLVLLAVAERYNVPDLRVERFMRVGATNPTALLIPTLIQRASILRSADFKEAEVYSLLNSGIVGDRKEIWNLFPMFDNVEFMVKMGRVVKSLESDTTFD